MFANKVLVICNDAWSMYNFRFDLIKRLRRKKYDIEIVTPLSDYTFEFEQIGCKLWNVKFKRSYSLSLFISDVVKLRKILKAFNGGSIIIYTIKPLFVFTIASVFLRKKFKVISVVPGLGRIHSGNSLLLRFLRTIHLRILNRSDQVFVLNTLDAVAIIRRGVDKHRVTTLPGEGLSEVWFQDSINAPEKYKGTLLYAGRIFPDKGVDVLLDFVEQRLLETTLQIAGSFEDEGSDLAVRVRKLKNQGALEYLGFNDDVKSVISSAKFVILPTRYNEGLPRVLMEALALGTPIITTKFPGWKKVVEDAVNGFVAEDLSSEAILEAIKKAENMSIVEYSKMCSRARTHAKNNFQLSQIVTIFCQSLEN